MIQHIQLCANHAPKVRKLDLHHARVDFTPGYNALIGPNGAGKSTVLRALATCSTCRVDRTAHAEIKYITTETLNPRVGGAFSSREEMVQGIRAMFRSHGQGVLDTFKNQRHRGEAVVLVDSPETGQDFANSQAIHQALLHMAAHYQVIIATNSLVFMRGAHLIDLGGGYLPWLIQKNRELLGDFE